MGKREREKGKRGERELAAELRRYGFNARRGVQYQGSPGSPDVTGLPGIHIEVKRIERGLNLETALKQAEIDSGDEEIPIVAHRRNREKWKITMTLEDFLFLYKETQYDKKFF